MSSIKTYSELIRYSTFEDRLKYLQLNKSVGIDTFGFDRYLNQMFYKSAEWKSLRQQIILRDRACDLAIKDREIFGKIYVHHMNPLQKDDIINNPNDYLLNPEYLVCVSHSTHNFIHYGNGELKQPFAIREKNDTILWRK